MNHTEAQKRYRSSEKGKEANRRAQRNWRKRHSRDAQAHLAAVVAYGEQLKKRLQNPTTRLPPVSVAETGKRLAKEMWIQAYRLEEDGKHNEAQRLRVIAAKLRPARKPKDVGLLVGFEELDLTSDLEPHS